MYRLSTNVLVASSNVKLWTGITSTDYDETIEALNPIILDDITNYCKNSFVRSTMYQWDDNISFSTSTGSNSIISNASTSDVDFTEFIDVGNIIRVVDAIQNNGYFSVVSVNSTVITVNETIKTESSSTGKFPIVYRVDYPDDIPFIGAKMIRWSIDSQNRDGLRSESLGDYSYTLQELVGNNMYPTNIVGGLKKYKKAKFL